MGARRPGPQVPAAESSGLNRPSTLGVGQPVRAVPNSGRVVSVAPSDDGDFVHEPNGNSSTPQTVSPASVPIGRPGDRPPAGAQLLSVMPIPEDRDGGSTRSSSAQALESASLLQERLKLSARMLKASQAQLETGTQVRQSLESAIAGAAQARSGLEAAVGEADQFASETLEQFESRIEQIASQQIRRFEETIAARLEQALQAEQRISDMLTQAQRLVAMVESAEINITVLAHRAAETAKAAEHKAAEAVAASHHCDETRSILAQDLIDADERIEQLAARAEQIRLAMTRQLAPCERIIDQLDNRVRDAQSTLDVLNRPSASTAATPLAPTEVTGDRPDVLDCPVSEQQGVGDMKTMQPVIEAMLCQIREVITTDMSKITSALGDIAARVDQLDHSDPPTPQIPPSESKSRESAAATSG